MNGLAASKDLTAEAPRGLDTELQGYDWLAREEHPCGKSR